MLKRVWRKGNHPILLVECKLVQQLWKTVWRCLKKLIQNHWMNQQSHSLAYIQEKIIIQKDKCTCIFILALFTIAKTWKQFKCPSTDEWNKKMQYMYLVEYYSAIKKQSNAICSNMEATRASHTKWCKSEREGQIPYHLYMVSKMWHKWTYLQNRN